VSLERRKKKEGRRPQRREKEFSVIKKTFPVAILAC
jgi:hypothetical protein